MFVEHLLFARYFSKCFMFFWSCNPHSNPDRLALVSLISQMKKFTSIQRVNRWQNRNSHLAPLIPSSLLPTHPPDERSLGIFLAIWLSWIWTLPHTVQCTQWDSGTYSWFSDYRAGEASLRRTASVWPGPLSVLSGPAEGLPSVPHCSYSFLLQPQMVTSSLS